MRAFLPTFLVNCILSVNSRFTDSAHVIEMPQVVEVLASSAFDSAVFLALHRLETPCLVLREGQLQSDRAVDERASPRPGLTSHCYTADFCLSDGPQKQPS